jgi:SulP family sulfate permease
LLYPKLFTTLRGYSPRTFFHDSVAGVVVGIVAIPLAIAFAIASGVTPDRGLLTAVLAGFLISALGGSRVQIGGPTGAFIVVVYGVVQKYGVDGLVLITILAGALLILMGVAGLGRVIEFIPHSVVVGFTSGIAVIIFSSQVNDFFGLGLADVPAGFLEKWSLYARHAAEVNLYAVAIAAGTFAITILWPRVSRRIPGSVIAVLFFSALAHVLHWPVETIGSRFGDLPHVLPAPHVPAVTLERVRDILGPAFTVALLGAIESLLSAVVADGMIGGRHRSNMELVAQGIANVASGLFGGMPATGAIARTVTNIKNGGRTPVAGIVHALTIGLVLIFFGRWVKLTPLAVLAGILVVVSYHMSEWRSFRALLRGPRDGVAVLLTTFTLTVLVDLTVAIEIGMVLALFLFMREMAGVTNVHLLDDEVELDHFEAQTTLARIRVPAGVEVYEVNGPFFFGIAHKFEEATRVVAKKPRVRILRLRNVPIIDATGLRSLREFHRKCRQNRIPLIVTGLHVQPLSEMIRTDLFDLIGEENVFNNMKDAVARAEAIMAAAPA